MNRAHGPTGQVNTRKLITSKHGKPPSSLRWSSKRRAAGKAAKALGIKVKL